MQELPDDAIRLIEIFSVKNGGVVHETIREVLDASLPGWHSAAAGVPNNYVRHVRNPNRFFLSPPPVAGTILLGEYAQSPMEYKLTQPIELLPDSYLPTVVDGTIWMAESIDNEHANSGRSNAYQQAFLDGLRLATTSRVITDTEMGGLGQDG
jgi:hypothetical protein